MNYTNPLLDYIDKVKKTNELVILDIKWHDDEHEGFMEVSADDCVRKCTLTQMKGIIDLAGKSDKDFYTFNLRRINDVCKKYEKELEEKIKQNKSNKSLNKSLIAKYNKMEKLKKYMFVRWNFNE